MQQYVEYAEQVKAVLRLLPPTADGRWPFYDWTKSLQLELTRNFPLSDLRVVLALIFFYWASVFIGTQIMRRRPTRVDLGSLPLYHNAINVLVSVYIVVETVRQAFVVGDYGICQPIDPTPKGLGMANVMWVFYASKLLEFGDTWIMVLKKNFHQITFLHLYHHSSVFFFWWAILSFGPNGETYFAALQNSVVHIIMYSYYFLVAYESHTKKKILNRRWKYYVTYIQLTQFALNTVEYIHSRYNNCNGYPVWIQHTYFLYMLSMITLFLNFLITSKRASAAAEDGAPTPSGAPAARGGKRNAAKSE